MKRILIIIMVLLILSSGCAAPVAAPPTQPSSASEQPSPSATEIEAPTTEPVMTEMPGTEALTTEAPTTEPTVVQTLPEILLSSMSVEEKIGQLFFARCPDRNAAKDAADYHLGGYILFGRDFEGKSREDVIANIDSYQNAASIPMLIAVDEEGGIVCRVSCYSAFRDRRFPSPRKLYDEGGLDNILNTEVEKIQLLSSLGINVNLAPVCDVTTDPNAFMYSRSLGQSPEETGNYITSMMVLMDKFQFGGVPKHFPGYGNNTDTHIGIAVDNRSLEALENVDLVPFSSGIRAGAGAIMVSHTFVNCLDAEMPASLSPKVIRYLRDNMGFEGVVITDDLVMQAITDLYGTGEAAVLAVLAGVDMLCSTDYQTQYQAVLEAVETGRITQQSLDQAVLRILNWKNALGLLQ